MGDLASAVESVNPFEQRSVKLNALLKEKKFDDAERLIYTERSYFEKRYKEVNPTLELAALAEHIWQSRYAKAASIAEAQLQTDDLMNTQRWAPVREGWVSAGKLIASFEQEYVLTLTRKGVEQMTQLRKSLDKARVAASQHRPAVIDATGVSLLKGEPPRSGYPGGDISSAELTANLGFQARLIDHWKTLGSYAALTTEAKRLEAYAGDQAKAEANQRYVDLLKAELSPSGRASLDSVVRISELASFPFPNAQKPPLQLAKVGLVDMTAAQFRDRNRFDFEVKFANDLGVDASDAKADLMSAGGAVAYDYLFVVDLSAASIDRRFKENKNLESRFQSGTRQEPNPAYVSAMTSYRTALADYQGVQIQARSQSCNSVAACVLLGIAQAASEVASKKRVDDASSLLQRTPQTLTYPVYTPYSYRRVSIDATKSAVVDYYIVDVKGRHLYKNSFTKAEAKTFDVAYNVHGDDPDRTSILRNVQSEDDVVAWEKTGLTVPLRALFDPKNLASAKRESYAGPQQFLAAFEKRQFANEARGGAAGRATPSSGSVIADPRFDSVVLIRTPKGLGTGFYVSPELVLTAYHVVSDVQLVEMSFFDGAVTYGKVVDHDVRLDLALVRAQRAGKPVPIFDGQVRLGSTVEAIGHPRGLEFTITRGVISALRKQKSMLTGPASADVEFIQTDTPSSPGNSGGPLFLGDAVIGVVDNARVDKGSQNLNFSVSYNEIRSYLRRFGVR